MKLEVYHRKESQDDVSVLKDLRYELIEKFNLLDQMKIESYIESEVEVIPELLFSKMVPILETMEKYKEPTLDLREPISKGLEYLAKAENIYTHIVSDKLVARAINNKPADPIYSN